MKQLFLFACLCLILSTLSCDKKDEITDVDQFPAWLQTKITELTSEFDLCKMTDVTIIEYKGERYYHIYCGLWSCMYCQLFDQKGNRPTFTDLEWNDFLTNKKDIKTLPTCP